MRQGEGEQVRWCGLGELVVRPWRGAGQVVVSAWSLLVSPPFPCCVLGLVLYQWKLIGDGIGWLMASVCLDRLVLGKPRRGHGLARALVSRGLLKR